MCGVYQVDFASGVFRDGGRDRVQYGSGIFRLALKSIVSSIYSAVETTGTIPSDIRYQKYFQADIEI